MKLLITGGCGYIGSYLVPYLAEHFHEPLEELVLYDNLSLNDYSVLYQHQVKGVKVKFVKADILDDRRSLLKALDGVDTVLHLAAKVTQPYTDVQLSQFDQVNNWGSASLADAIEQSPSVRSVIYLSSITVYGTSERDINEDHKPEPITYYGLSKLKGEKHILRIPGIKKYILRSSNVYGYAPAMRIDSVINRFMFEGHFFDQVNKISDGQQSRAFVHIEHLAEYILAVLKGSVEEGTYNIAEHNWSINQILDEFQVLFPALDVITVDQDAKLDRVNIELPTKISAKVKIELRPFQEELQEFHSKFSF